MLVFSTRLPLKDEITQEECLPLFIKWVINSPNYSIDAVEKYKQIVFYKNLGFSLDEIKKIQLATKEELQIVLQKKREELFHSIKKFETQIKIIDELCDSRSQRPALAEILLLPFENDPDVVGKWKLCGKV